MTEKRKSKRRLRRTGYIPPVRDLIQLVLGSLISAMAVNVFYVPIRLTMGGVTGVATIIFQLARPYVHLPLGLLVIVLNVPIFAIGITKISKSFAWRSLIGTLTYSVIIDLTAPTMAPWFEAYINRPLQNGRPDPLLYCVFGGVLFGIGAGLIFRSGFTTGGTDILAFVIKRKRPDFSTGQFIMVLDASIVLASVVFYRNSAQPSVLLAMYSFIAMFLTSKAVDILLEGFDFTRTAIIVSDKASEIASRIMTEVNRGVTSLSGRGMYTGQKKDVLMCVLSSKQVPELKSIVETIDESAFMIVFEAREVVGEGFGAGHEIE